MQSLLYVVALVLVISGGLSYGSSVRIFEQLGYPDERPPINVALDSEWIDYIKTFNKTYKDDAERDYRRYIWEDNLSQIFKHNREMVLGKHTYTMGVNQFTDMTTDEFTAIYLSGLKPTQAITGNNTFSANDPWVTLPDSVDWRSKGLVTPVKKQGSCASCWAFSATGAIEGQHAKQTGTLVSLSEQNLIDCSSKYGNKGCQSGFMDRAFKYVIDNRGIDTEECYPYSAKDGTCKYKNACKGAAITSYKQTHGESTLQKVSAEVGPMSVAIMATSKLMSYKSGIFSDNTCNTGQLNHGVLVVGYASDYASDYWIVKNSWGTAWGMAGYFYLARNKENMCGVATYIFYPVV